MHRVVLEVDDRIFDNILYFVNSLPKDDVRLIDDQIVEPDKEVTIASLNAIIEQGDPFKEINDPLAWQREARDEW